MKMTEPAYFVLAALLDGPRHGYDIAARAAEVSDDRVKLSAGTLYGVLERLSTNGQIELDHEETVNGRLRRYHRITGAGADAVATESERLKSAAAAVDQKALSSLRSFKGATA
jgi:DNA-binding PadR family transcriptional regulator